jgi:hypothetical protein
VLAYASFGFAQMATAILRFEDGRILLERTASLFVIRRIRQVVTGRVWPQEDEHVIDHHR